MDNYERTIDLVHVFNYVKYNLKKIIITTIVFALLGVGLVTAKNIISPSEKLYYSTAKILFKFDSWSTSEKDYSLEDWKLTGTEEYRSDSNISFFSNSKYVFSTDQILLELIKKYNLDKDLDEFKENIIVENMPNSDIVRIIVTATTPEIAEDMLNTIIADGIKSVENLYELKYEIMDKYTNSDESFSELELDEYGDINLSSSLMSDIKMIILFSMVGMILSIIYFVLKCVLNTKVENVDQIEGELGVSVLQVLEHKDDILDEAATKLINSEIKTVLVTCITRKESIDDEILGLAKSLKLRNKKSLILCVDSNECQNNMCELDGKKEINLVDDISIINSDIGSVDKVLENNINEFDFVLIKSNCLDSSSDALLISKKIDYTLMVIRCNMINVDKFSRKVQEFKKYSSGIDGIILKDATKYSSCYKFVKNNQ